MAISCGEVATRRGEDAAAAVSWGEGAWGEGARGEGAWGEGAVRAVCAVGAVVEREERAAVAVVGEVWGPGGVAEGAVAVAVAEAVAVAVAGAAEEEEEAAAAAGGEPEPASSAEIARRSVLVRACKRKCSQ